MLGLVGIAYQLTPAELGGDIVAVGPYIVSHIGIGLTLVLLYVLVILAACYSTIDGASSALSSVVAVDIVKRYFPQTSESTLFVITKVSVLIGGIISTAIVLSGLDFTTLVLTTYALKTSILLPLILAILWPKTNMVGFVGGIIAAIVIGMPIYEMAGELPGTLSIVAISGLTVFVAGMLGGTSFELKSLRSVSDEVAISSPAE
jgi:Na+/proline symporter